MLDAGAYPGRGVFDLHAQFLRCAIAHRVDLAVLGGHVPLYAFALHIVALVNAGAARVAECIVFMAVQQGMCQRNVEQLSRQIVRDQLFA
ncbi:hypothetical protein A9975_01200 [Cupriavidus sp. UME77]|nr:hypothetical protein [Cupriavidus sp. UME77]